ncbi:MAG TPA: response regulator transcription factor [Chloroflexota bacterium]|jgi:DNA-binding NarL/FixJ family response regulator|nr:response regulator transcription factor [Chloroflexota bacterium]
MIRLLLVDDHELVRAGLRAMLAGDPAVNVVGEAATGAAALLMARGVRPDVVLLDARLPDMPGDEVCRRLLLASPHVAVVMLTTFAEDDLVRRCVRAGARGYLLKDIAHLDLGRSLAAVMRGEAVIDSKVAPAVLAAARQGSEPLDASKGLNARQRDVLRLVAEGLSNREIAERTHLSEHTVKGYVEEILERLGARNRVHAAIVATKQGLI